ncbi:hypothetical protein C162_21933 [Paenibacillus sp. FSL R7-269]|uniref:DUF2786 domain-containing protein n=1 Tax=Paenibacillus sp. FSL R7-269 TaxID=1226755 RepID=UPI0003E225F4|nr:DUF2786 domain-containing protein [Paenibacillus sp. FSL R7-269]ETT45241.1 hypothetical protein C162_21933 [Paenibacillus sp. FSL R7-269]
MDSAIRKIQKALKLADRNSNAEEAQAAILLAQRLMAKHGLSASDIGSDEQKQPEAQEGKIRKSRIEWWHRKLLNIVADNFRCFSFYASGSYIGFLGLPEDVEIAKEVYVFAEDALRYHSSEFLKTRVNYFGSRKRTNALKNDYITGFLQGLREKFKEQVETESLALVLVKHEVVVQANDEANWKTGKPIQMTSLGNGEARA